MRTHREIPLSQNVLALSGQIEQFRDTGMRVEPTAVRHLCEVLSLFQAQARAMENSNRELIAELTAEDELQRPVRQITPLEGDPAGTARQRIEWVADEVFKLARRFEQLHPDLMEEVAHLRFLAMSGLGVADALPEAPECAVPASPRLRSWVKAVINGGRS